METVPAQYTDTADRVGERVPPHDVEAEQSTLGGMILTASAIGEVVEALEPFGGAAFYRPAHETIYNAIVGMYAKGTPVTPITLADELAKSGDLDRVGGRTYLHTLAQSCPATAHAAYDAGIVLERAKLRRLAEAGTRIAESGYRGQGEADDLINQASAEIALVAQTSGDRDGDTSLAAAFSQAVDEAERLQQHGQATGILTGYSDLDSVTHGLHPGQMIVIAGRPASGKSTAAADIARHAAIKNGHKVALFSLEMSRTELGSRIACAEARVALHHLRGGLMTDEDWKRIARASQRITDAPMHIFDNANANMTQIKAQCRRLQQREGLDLVVIDYLQLMNGSGRRAENRQVEVAQISRDVKLMAKELEVPVVILSQLNRGPEQRVDKRPMVSDLRESGGIENDADVVILIHREEVYDPDTPRAGEADLIVAKHRNGPTATITVASQLHYCRLVDMAHT